MCGIVGYVGREQAAPILLEGLSKLEYRGYDSAGVCVFDGGELKVAKAKGRLENLSQMTDGGRTLPGTVGIGHTRWATHGEPNDINSHPHLSEDGKIALVHNGIIENYLELREFLERKGVRIGVLGVTTEYTPYMVTASSFAPFEARSCAEAVKKYLPQMRQALFLSVVYFSSSRL